MQKLYFRRLQQWIHAGYRMPAQKMIVRPENHRKSVTSLTLIRSKSIVVYLGRRRTETTHQQRVGRPESHGYWMCCRRVAQHLRACWRRTFWAHTVIKMMWGDTCDLFWETITASHVIVCCHSVNHHSNIHLIIALTAQSDTSNFPR